MRYDKINSIAIDGEVIMLESIRNGSKVTRYLPLKDVPMKLSLWGKEQKFSLVELVKALVNEIERLKISTYALTSELKEQDQKVLDKLKLVAEQVDKITSHLNQEGSVV
jgi:hypothetical protein